MTGYTPTSSSFFDPSPSWFKPETYQDWETLPFRPSNSGTSETPNWDSGNRFKSGPYFDSFGIGAASKTSSDQEPGTSNFDKFRQSLSKASQWQAMREADQQQQSSGGLGFAGGNSQDLGGGITAMYPMFAQQPVSSGSGASTGSKLIGGLLAGAGAGSVFGPVGAGVGAGLGLIGSLVG